MKTTLGNTFVAYGKEHTDHIGTAHEVRAVEHVASLKVCESFFNFIA